MPAAKPYFAIPQGSVLRPHNDVSYAPGDEEALRSALTAEEITGYVDAGHLRATTRAEIAETAAAPAAAPAKAAPAKA